MKLELDRVENYTIRRDMMTFVCPRCGRKTVAFVVPATGEWRGKAVCLSCVSALEHQCVVGPTEFKFERTTVRMG